MYYTYSSIFTHTNTNILYFKSFAWRLQPFRAFPRIIEIRVALTKARKQLRPNQDEFRDFLFTITTKFAGLPLIYCRENKQPICMAAANT